MNRRTFLGAAAAVATLPAPADAGRGEGDGPGRPIPDESGIDADLSIRYDRDGLSINRNKWLNETDASADVILEAWDGELAVTAKRETDDELASAGFLIEPDEAERLAALLVEFAEHARGGEEGMLIYP